MDGLADNCSESNVMKQLASVSEGCPRPFREIMTLNGVSTAKKVFPLDLLADLSLSKMSPLRFSRFSIWFYAPSSNHFRIFAKSLKVSAGICRCHLITAAVRKDEKGQFHLFSTWTWTSSPSIQGGQHCNQVSNTIPVTSYMYLWKLHQSGSSV